MPSASVDLQSVADRLALKLERFVALLPVLLVAVLVVVLAWWLGRWISRRAVLARAARHNPFLLDLARSAVRWAVAAVGLVVALEILGATHLVGAVLGTAGVLGIALGFAFKNILENYLAGVLLSLRQPFAPRDHVEIGGHEGLVVALTSRATILMTLDGNHLRIPNAQVFGTVILNYTRNPLRRLEFEVGVGVDEDLLQAGRVGTDALAEVDGVIAQPPPRAQVVALGDWAVQLRYLAWVDQRSHEFRLVQSEAIRRVKEALDAAGVDMPYPVYRLRMDAASEPAPRAGRVEPAAGDRGGVDTRATHDVIDQVSAERAQRGRDDLLRPDAPIE